MRAGVLFSGGKDSALAALMLSRDYEVELNTFVFSRSKDLTAVRRAAEALSFPLFVREFGGSVLEEAIRLITARGYPNDAINMVHRQAIRMLCREYRVVGDGTRFNDRVPMLGRGEVQQLRDTCACNYVRPLLGFPKDEVDRLAHRAFLVIHGETGTIENGDYESGIRTAMREKGLEPVGLFPPHHEQSLVLGRNKECVGEVI
ncbi:MAG: alpha hydrolase [Methanoregulaceae archaeon]|nr:alpha hydrolase [Methanoregulaceae archaeon]